jgi:hypothetical protein
MPPTLGFVFLNFETAIFKDLGGMEVGVVGRDHLGVCIVAYLHAASSTRYSWSLVEAMALRRATMLAWDKGVVHVMFASDRLC